MNPLQMEPPGPPQQPQRRSGAVLSPSQWLNRHVLAVSDSTITSLGEFLLPTLIGAMEACWIAAVLIGLAGAGMFGVSAPLLPFWAPFVFIIGTQWLFYAVDRRGENARHNLVFFVLVALLCLFIIWLDIYSPKAFIIDPRWLAALFSDTLFLNSHFYQAVFIIVLSFILCWRGLRLASRTIEPSSVFRELCLGIVIMIVVTVLRAELASSGTVLHDDVLLLLLIPLFLYLSLAAHALARIAFVRRTHATGLQGSIVAQERAVMTVVGLFGAILLVITIIIAIFASPAFFTSAIHTLAPVGTAIANAYDWLVMLIADIVVIIATPFFWLISWLSSLVHPKAPNQPNPAPANRPAPKSLHNSMSVAPGLLLVIKILLPIVVLLVIFLLIRRAIRLRRKNQLSRVLRDEDVHESLWSWALFWSQLRAMLRALFGRFLPAAAVEEDGHKSTPASTPGITAANDIRAVYRAFLKKAAVRGFARARDETPDELRLRLDEKAPLVEPQLEAITGAYTMVRYGESVPDPSDIASAREKWTELDQKWV